MRPLGWRLVPQPTRTCAVDGKRRRHHAAVVLLGLRVCIVCLQSRACLRAGMATLIKEARGACIVALASRRCRAVLAMHILCC